MNSHWDELLNRWRKGNLSTDDLRRLNDALATKEGRAALRSDWFLETALPEALRAAPLFHVPRVEALRKTSGRLGGGFLPRWLSWRPLVSAAAGIVFGTLCTSVVFAYVSPSLGRARLVFREGFEKDVTKTNPGLPRDTERWAGDEAVVVANARDVKPRGGNKMLRFVSATYPGENSPRSQWGDVYRVVDVRGLAAPGAGRTMARLSAHFAQGTVGDDHQFACSVEIFALDAELAGLPSRLTHVWLRQNSSASASRNLPLSSESTWQEGAVEVPITPQTRFVLLHLAVIQSKPAIQTGVVEFPAHFMDDVKLEIMGAR